MAPWMGWDAPSAGLSSPLNSSFEVQGIFSSNLDGYYIA